MNRSPRQRERIVKVNRLNTLLAGALLVLTGSAGFSQPNVHTVAIGGTGTAPYLQTALDDLMDFLASNGVSVKQINGQPKSRTSSLEDMRALGADSLIYITVELVMGTRAKLTIQCFDTQGKPLWEENAGAGGFSLGGALKSLLKSGKKKIEPHIGGAGLPKGTG
jgi:hypothetical protein